MPSYKKLRPDAIPPTRAHPEDAGSDLAASAAPIEVSVGRILSSFDRSGCWRQSTIKPGGIAEFHLGLVLEVPIGYEGQIRSRSGLGARRGFVVRQGTGTVDAGYRGEIRVVMVNNSDMDVVITNQDRIAQLVVAAVSLDNWREDPYIQDDTPRGANGFGSTDTTKPA